MITLNGYHYNLLALALLLLANSCKPSCGYRNIRLQDYLCADRLILALQKPFRGDPAFTLKEERDSGAIITQTWNATLPSLFATEKVKYDCKFRVETLAHPRRGIYTLITRLKFRHDPATGGCLDYIQFSNGNRPPSDKICNDIDIKGPGGRLIFEHHDREVNVHIHIDKQHVIREPLELNMVMTAHSECKYTGDFLCDPQEPSSCISRHFVRDNITNCMHPCRDEISCFHDAVSAVEIDTTNVALSAAASLIFTMVGVSLCIWLCWKYWNCITVQQHAHEASAAARRHVAGMQDVPVIELPTAPTEGSIITASINMEHIHNQQYRQQQQEMPKDLPPSYESLFPDS